MLQSWNMIPMLSVSPFWLGRSWYPYEWGLADVSVGERGGKRKKKKQKKENDAVQSMPSLKSSLPFTASHKKSSKSTSRPFFLTLSSFKPVFTLSASAKCAAP